MTDRLPTVSASQALQIDKCQRRGIPTNLPSLDAHLRPGSAPGSGGISRGQVTEVFGPPGVGKTAFALQVASDALRAGDKVVWIDTASPLPGPRLRRVIANSSPSSTIQPETLLSQLTHFTVPTLSHLLVLFLHPTKNFPPAGTALIVVDTVSDPLSTSFPGPSNQSSSHLDPSHRKAAQAAIARKGPLAGDLGAGMAKMAGLGNIAVLALSQVATGKEGGKLCLRSAMAFDDWKAAVQNRLALWRDMPESGTANDDAGPSQMRVVEIIKVNRNVRVAGQEGNLFPFIIDKVSVLLTPLHTATHC